jgi:hypothetical protein
MDCGITPCLARTYRSICIGEAITVTPSQGPVGQTVTVTGTGWQDHASRGIDVPIWIGFGNQVADGHPDANGKFSVSFAIPLNLPSAPDFANGKLTISAIIGNGGSADAIYTVTTAATGTTTSPTTGQSQPTPGWYKNSDPSVIAELNTGLRVTWENSYIYEHPGADNLYWYAEIVYFNNGSQNLTLNCTGLADPALAKEHLRGTEGIPPDGDGYVAADETFCSRNHDFSMTLKPGETHYEWSIFHNVPPGGEIALEWAPFGSSPWVNPWYSSFSASPPDECSPELVTLGMCQHDACVFRHNNTIPVIQKEVGHVAWGWRVPGSNPEQWDLALWYLSRLKYALMS